MKNCGRRNVREHRDIKNGNQYVVLDIYKVWWYGKDENHIFRTKILFGNTRKGVYYLSGSQEHYKAKKIKKIRFAINEVSLKDISKTIKGFKDLPYDCYARKRPKHMHTESYLYPKIQLAKFIMSTQNMINSRSFVRTQNRSTQKMTNSHVCFIDESKSKSFTLTRANK